MSGTASSPTLDTSVSVGRKAFHLGGAPQDGNSMGQVRPTAGRLEHRAQGGGGFDFEDFFENCQLALHPVGGDVTILRANKAELELLGYSADEYLGRHIADFHADQSAI